MRASRPPPDARSADVPPLGEWLHVFAPRYRSKLVWIALLNTLSAGTLFAELQLLKSLTIVLGGARPSDAGLCGIGGWLESGLSFVPQLCGLYLPHYLLVAYILLIALQSGFDLAAFSVNSRLSQQARHDMERELLRNLLMQDDAFYLRRAPSEIISRLSSDLFRVGARRQAVTQAINTLLTIVAIAWVLVSQSVFAATIGIATSLLGVLAAQPVLNRLRALDRETTRCEEQVKALFEDTLQGVAEIQLAGVISRVLGDFEQRQRLRDTIALRNADLNNRNMVLQKLTFTAGFIAVLALFVLNQFGGPVAPPTGGNLGQGASTAGLIVVLVSTLPQLYFRFGELTQLSTQFQIADVPAARLIQYQAPPAFPPAGSVPAEASPDGAIGLRGVRYQFSGSQAVQGGPDGINCTIPARGMTGIVGHAGAGKSTLLRLVLGRQRPLDGTIRYPEAHPGAGSLFAYLPQRPVLLDARLSDNLFLSRPSADAQALMSLGERLGALGLLPLIREKGLDALPGPAANAGPELEAVRAGFREAAREALGMDLAPLGPGRAAWRQMVIEGQLGCAVDQDALADRLTSPYGRPPVSALAELPYGDAMAGLAAELVMRTAPLLAQASNPDDYNRFAVVKIAGPIWQLRTSALELISGPPAGGASTQRLLVAVALSARLEELGDGELPMPGDDARPHLEKLVADIAAPFRTAQLNPWLTWRENLLFAVPDRANVRRLEQLERALVDRLHKTPLEDAVIEAGLDYPVGRQGGRLSGGQQQLIALGRALLNPAPFLVLDEPSSAFDPQRRIGLIAVLQAEARARSVIVVTHDMEMARACDHLLFVHDGMLAGQGSWARLAEENGDFRSLVAVAGGAA